MNHRSVLLPDHHVHEGVRIAEIEAARALRLQSWTLSLLAVGRRKGMVRVRAGADGQRSERQEHENKMTFQYQDSYSQADAPPLRAVRLTLEVRAAGKTRIQELRILDNGRHEQIHVAVRFRHATRIRSVTTARSRL